MIRLRQIRVLVEEDSRELLIKKIKKVLQVDDIRDVTIVKRSIDARQKSSLFYVYEVDVTCQDEMRIIKKTHSPNVFLAPNEEYIIPAAGSLLMKERPVIIGSGPAGLFCGYL